MLIFIDDSGDPGFKTDRGSSRAFIIAMVCFSDNLAAEKTASTIKSLQKGLGWPEGSEFRFSKTRSDHKIRFFQAVRAESFVIHAIVFQKKHRRFK